MDSRNLQSEEVPVEELPIIGPYNLQRFTQFCPEDNANWSITPAPRGKRPLAYYPAMGRQHIVYLGTNQLIFSAEPRAIFVSINFYYIVVGQTIYRFDAQFNKINISQGKLATISGNMYFDYLVAGTITFACFTDGVNIYVSREDTESFDILTGIGVPLNPTFIAAFGNRIAVSQGNSSQFNLSIINLGGNAFDANTAFDNGAPTPIIFANEDGIIRQMCVLHNTLYIFTDYTTGVWSNQSVSFVTSSGTVSTFPWKKNTTYSWDFGMADPLSLDVGFDRMVFLAKNKGGLLQVMESSGQHPERISDKAIDVLFQKYANNGGANPFLEGTSDGFIYQFENTIFYRLSAGNYNDYGLLDIQNSSNSIEYNFETKTWKRCIEKNGERNRIKKHIFFNNMHLVTVSQDNTVYQMSGLVYTNEITNPQATDPQGVDAYIAEPFRYERVTPIISEKDYSEFETDYIEIDFVWGDSNIVFSTNPFLNAEFIIDESPGLDGEPVFVIDEQVGADGGPVYMITERGNTPEIGSPFYNKLFKPHIEVYYSDNGGISFFPADVRQFSDMGVYQWRMRWYQLGVSRNRCYKLICVSPVPIVVLGGVMLRRRIGGGAN